MQHCTSYKNLGTSYNKLAFILPFRIKAIPSYLLNKKVIKMCKKEKVTVMKMKVDECPPAEIIGILIVNR